MKVNLTPLEARAISRAFMATLDKRTLFGPGPNIAAAHRAYMKIIRARMAAGTIRG